MSRLDWEPSGRGRPGTAEITLLQLARAGHAVARVRQRPQARLRDRRRTLLTTAEIPGPHALQGGVDLDQHLFLALDQAERELLLEGVGADLGRVERGGG